MKTKEYFLADASNNKARLQKLNLIGALPQDNIKHRVFLKFYRRYGQYLPEYANYFGRIFRLNNSMYSMNNYRNIFADELTNLLIY